MLTLLWEYVILHFGKQGLFIVEFVVHHGVVVFTKMERFSLIQYNRGLMVTGTIRDSLRKKLCQ